MAKGFSIHLGLNSVDASHYQGWPGTLNACERDAHDMQAVAAKEGFETRLLLTREATAGALLGVLRDAASKLISGDILLLTYSGHGGQVPDTNGDEDDGRDETWVMYDRMVIDDELYSMWSRFRSGVRIVVLSDSCHSGTVVKAYADAGLNASFADVIGPGYVNSGKAIPEDACKATYEAHQKQYDGLQAQWPNMPRDTAVFGASVLLISGCQDNQTSSDGPVNGLFTGTLLRILADGSFRGSYRELATGLAKLLPPTQQPKYFVTGTPNQHFELERPFSIVGELAKTVTTLGRVDGASNVVAAPFDAAALEQLLAAILSQISRDRGLIDVVSLIPAILGAATKAQLPASQPAQRLFGIDDALLIAIAGAVAAAVKKDGPVTSDRGLIDVVSLIPAIVGAVTKAQPPASQPAQRLLGIDDALLIAIAGAVAAAVKKDGPVTSDRGLLDVVSLIPAIVGAVTKAQPPASQPQRLFGIDDALLIAIAGAVAAAVKKDGPVTSDRGLLDVVSLIPAIVGAVTKAQPPASQPAQRLFGIDDALLAAIVTAVTAATR